VTDQLPMNVMWTMAGIVGLLVLASVIAFVMVRSQPERDLGELVARIKSWWLMVAIFTIAMAVSRTVSVVFLGFVSFLALKEYLSLIPTRRADRRVLFWAYLAVPLQFYWVSSGWYGLFINLNPVYVLLFLPQRMVTVGETSGFLAAAGTLHWGLMTTVFSLSHAAYLLALPAEVNPSGGGAGLLLYLVFLTQFNDVAQYVWGKLFGKDALVPRVSPKKTLQGLAGGLGTTIVMATLLAPWLTPLDLPGAFVAGVLISVGGFVGDITISALKRDLGVKDSGNLIPGHGGILDRVDSLTYTAPLFFHYVYWLHY
jgi:phosphatidate cytidylyltransferase